VRISSSAGFRGGLIQYETEASPRSRYQKKFWVSSSRTNHDDVRDDDDDDDDDADGLDDPNL
jgi:hypothetical protein